jgi:hypothetical protein
MVVIIVRFVVSQFLKTGGLRPFGSLDNIKFYEIAFLESAIPFAEDPRIMNKHVGTSLTADKPIALRIIKPLYNPFQEYAPPVYVDGSGKAFTS